MLNEDSDDDEDEVKAELKKVLRQVYDTTNRNVKELQGKLFLLSCLIDFFFQDLASLQ